MASNVSSNIGFGGGGGGGGGGSRSHGMTDTQRGRLHFAWRASGGNTRVSTPNGYPLYETPSDGVDCAMYDMAGGGVLWDSNELGPWNDSESAIDCTTGLRITNVNSAWTEYVAADPFAILFRVKLQNLPSSAGNWMPLLQSRVGNTGVSWNLRTDDQTIRFRPKDSGGTDLISTIDQSISGSFDTTSYHDFIVTSDGSTLDWYYDDTKIGSTSYTGSTTSDLQENTNLFQDHDGSQVLPFYARSFVFDTMYWQSSDVSSFRKWADGKDL